MSEHTPEPWWADEYDGKEMGCAILAVKTDAGLPPGNPTRGIVAFTTRLSNFFARECAANARRIVACVNACAGLSTEDLERATGGKLNHLCYEAEAAKNKEKARAEEAERLLRNLVEADETVVTASYCEYCDSHADKNDDGQLTAPVLHSIGCPMKEARAFLDRRPK